MVKTINNPLISILTINYNSIDETIKFLESLLAQNYKTFELILVDNGSRDFDEKEIKKLFPEAMIISSRTNLGFAAGNNLGLKHASGEFVFFVNNDVVLTPNCLTELVQTARTAENLGAVSPKFYYRNSNNRIEYAGCNRINLLTGRTTTIGGGKIDNGDYTGLIKTSYIHGGGMLVPAHVIKSIGEMDESFFLYYEELDWSEKIRKGGYTIYCQRDAVVEHNSSASLGQDNTLKTYFLNRNRILFMRRNFETSQLLPFFVFYSVITFPSKLLRMLFYGRIGHAKAYVLAVAWNFFPQIKYKTNY